jgi:hypothetical protein
MVTIRNTADTARGVHTATGLVMIDPGEAKAVELSPKDRASLASCFVVVPKAKAAAKPAPVLKRASVKKEAAKAEPVAAIADD